MLKTIQVHSLSIRRMWLMSMMLLLTESIPKASSQGFVTPQIIKFENNNNGNGQYSFEFETSDGTYRLEEGGAGGAGAARALRVRGVYRYRGADGRRYSVQYAADENGYRASPTDALALPYQSLMVLMIVAAMAVAAPAPDAADANIARLQDMMPILYDRRAMDEYGGYSNEFETADGQYRQEVGMILNKGTKDETKVVMGQYSFKDAFGKTKHYIYMADRNGYRVMQAKQRQEMIKAIKSLIG